MIAFYAANRRRASRRLKRPIKSSGYSVYPAQVEAVLREHPAVALARVVRRHVARARGG